MCRSNPDLPQVVVSTAVDAMDGQASLASAIARLGPSLATVLVSGPSPEHHVHVARALHDISPRRDGPFVVLDCREDGARELEHRLGGPVSQRVRRTAPAPRGQGTLYVAAVDCLPLLLQPRLMTFLDEQARPRVVVSTHTDLGEAVRDECFRSDLARRLQLVTLAVHPGWMGLRTEP